MNNLREDLIQEVDIVLDRIVEADKEFDKDMDGLKKEFRQGKEDWKNLTSQPGWFIAPLLLIGMAILICFSL